MRKCLYCKSDISNESVIDFCERCGKRVWGDKMFSTIIEKMESSRENGDIESYFQQKRSFLNESFFCNIYDKKEKYKA